MVEGEDVEMGRECEERGLLVLEGVECFADAVGESEGCGALVALEAVSLCCVWMRVLTTSSGVVMTPAMPPALAAVAISRGRPMLLEPMWRFALSRSSS